MHIKGDEVVHVEIGLFEEDNLLFQGEIQITEKEYEEENELIRIKHQIINDEAIIELRVFDDGEQIIKSTLDMPVHESEEWESIQLAHLTLAFKCKLNA